MQKLTRVILFTFICVINFNMFGQSNTYIPNLNKINNEDEWTIVNRKAEIKNENNKQIISFNAQPGNGFARLKNYEFNQGIIEVDIKGTDIQGRSFVGIAFGGVNDEIYDAVYFRPFNYNSEDPIRRGHSVQYISHPEYTWYKLRQEHPGEYENAVNPVPNPNEFFHAKIVIENSSVDVYVNNSEKPSLSVEKLTKRESGWIGLWMGNNSDGCFANLKITEFLPD